METQNKGDKENKGAKKAEPRKTVFPIESSLNLGGGLSDLLVEKKDTSTKKEDDQALKNTVSTSEVTKNISAQQVTAADVPAEEDKNLDTAKINESNVKPSALESSNSINDPEFDSFLAPSEVGKKGTSIYVSAETHKSIEKIIKYLGDGTTIGDYAENVFAEHFRKYGKEIRKRIEAARKKEDKESLRF
jgi:hypothetical protein